MSGYDAANEDEIGTAIGVAEQGVRVCAELVATVLSVLVEPGDRVHAGQELVVLESMKMEIPVQAPVPGRVQRVGVEVGDLVQDGDLIALLEPGPDNPS